MGMRILSRWSFPFLPTEIAQKAIIKRMSDTMVWNIFEKNVLARTHVHTIKNKQKKSSMKEIRIYQTICSSYETMELHFFSIPIFVSLVFIELEKLLILSYLKKKKKPLNKQKIPVRFTHPTPPKKKVFHFISRLADFLLKPLKSRQFLPKTLT